MQDSLDYGKIITGMNEENQEKKSKKKIITLIAAIVLILIAALVVFWFNSQIRATTMRILRMEGIVSLEDNGKKKTATDNLRLKSGNALSTDIKSLVSIGLDDTKIVTLDEKSRAEFNQKGRKLDLKLTDGSLFFEVQKPLAADESFDIKTSTMVVGIRGTSGWVSVDGEHEQLIVTDGKVHVIGTNPTTGEVKEIDVKAGQRITVYLYNDRNVDSIMFVLEEVTERELPEFLLNRLRENPELLDKVCRETGWDKPWILGQVRDEMPVVKIDDVPPDDGPDDDNDGGDSLSEEEIEDESALDPDIDPAHPRGARWSERRAARKRIIFTDVNSGIVALDDGTLFDPAFYAATNPDVVADYGTDTDALLAHWLKIGKREGRPPIAPRTPTPTPIWMVQPVEGGDGDGDDDDDDDHKPVSRTGGVLNGFTAFGQVISLNGVQAQVNQVNGKVQISMPYSQLGNGVTAITLPGSVTKVDPNNSNNNYQYSLKLKPGEDGYVNFNLANLNNVEDIDMSSSRDVRYDDIKDFMNSLGNTNSKVKQVKGYSTTVNKSTNNSNQTTYQVSIDKGNGLISSGDFYNAITNFPNNNAGTTVTYDGLTIKPNNEAEYNNKPFTNITVQGTGNTGEYDVYGDNNGTNYKVGTFDGSGFTYNTNIP